MCYECSTGVKTRRASVENNVLSGGSEVYVIAGLCVVEILHAPGNFR